MECERCGHENSPAAKFCAACGAPLERRCPTCDARPAPDAAFCDQCGTSLGAATSPAAGAPADPAPTSRAVRKQVTALFADLVGSTAFGERVDPEAARAALTPYFEILRSTVEDHAGTVVKFTGDGVFAVFGLPEVAEDDARRAVAAGQDLQHRFGAFANTVRDRHGVELGLRVGVNSGELVVGDDDEDLVGDVLNTAARLEAACAPGRVLVGEDTWRLTRSGVRYEVLGEISVNGKSEPIATFQVAELPDAAIEENIPFVGRDAELAQLLDAFAEARDSPVLRLVTVVGDPGVGKTRLASEVRGATSARSFDLRFERRGSTTFGPIADLLRLITDGTADGVARLLDEHHERDRLVPILRSMLGFEAVRSTEESFWGVRRLLEHLSEQHGPLLVVVDDIQWAEPLFWDLLDHLVEWTEAPVLVIALARPELRELRPELTQAGRRVAASIALDGLGADDTRELAARLLDVEELPHELTGRIPASTDGNPLFVRELVNMLVDDGTLERDGDRWRLTIDADAIDVPPTIISLLASRVERLPDDERRAIELASVIGTDFDRGTLAAIAAEDGSTGPLGVVLDRLRRRDLVEPSGSWSGDHPVYRFHHVLVRDAAYRRLLKQRRATLHELVGRHVDEHHPGGDETDVVVAHHFEQVVRYRRDLGTVDAATEELAHDAVDRLRAAADSALAREDLPAAGSAAQRALDLVGENSAERDELLLVGCEALLSSGDVGAAEPLVSELTERSTDDRLAAWADCFRAQRWSLTDPDRLVEATDTADRAADALTSLGDAAGVAKARLVRAGCLARLGRVGECENELDLALGAARDAEDRRRTVAVLGAAPLAALWGPSPVSRAGGRCLDVLRLLRITTASPAVETTSIRCQAVLEALRGRLGSARDKLEQSRSTSQELGLRQGLFETELFAGFVELWAGEPGAAEPHLRAAHDGLGRLGIGADAGQAAALLARALLDRGDLDAADALATEAFDSAGQNLQTAISSRSALAEVRAAQGRHDEAAALAAEAVEIAGRTDIVLDHAVAVEAAGRVARQAGDPGAAAAAQFDARRLLADKGVTAERGVATDSVDEPDRPNTHGAPSEPASSLALWNRSAAVMERMLEAARRGDRAAFVDATAPGLINRRHEPMRSVESSTVEEMTEAVFNRGSTGHVDSIDGVVVAVRGERLHLTRLEQPSGDFDMTLYVLGGCDEHDRLELWETYGPDQYDEAIAELDRRWAEQRADRTDPASTRNDEVTSSRVWRWNLDFYERMLAGDRDGYDRMFSPDATFEVRRASSPLFAGPIGVFIDQHIMSWVDVGLEGIDSDPIEEHGDDRCLIRATVTTTAGDLSSMVFLNELDTEGRGTRFVSFDHDQIVDALAELRSVTVDPNDPVTSLGAGWEAVEPGRRAHVDRVSLAIAVGPLDVFAACFAPDFVVVDRRAMGLGTRDLAAFIESNTALVGNVIAWTAETIETSDKAALTRVEVRSTVDESSWAMLLLTEYAGPGDDHLITRWTQFDVDDRAGAITAFRALGAVHAGLPPLANTANDVAQRYHAARAAGDLDAIGAILHPDFEYVEATVTGRALDAPSPGREQMLRSFPEFSAKVGTPRIVERDVVAIRADSLVMSRGVETFGDDAIPYCGVAEIEDGLLRRTTVFAPGQFQEALDELDRRWVELGGSAELAEISQRWRTAMMRPVLDRADLPVSDDVVTVDHRRGCPGRRSLGEYLESIDSVVPVEEWHPVRYFDDRPPFHFAQERLVVDADGSTWDTLTVCRRDGAELVEVHVFDLDQFDEAQALFDALTLPADHPAVPDVARPVPNEAWDVVEAYVGAWTDRDRDRMRALLADDYEHRGRDGVLDLDADGAVEGALRADVFPGRSGRERRLLAVRGDRLCLDMETVPFEEDALARFCVWECVDGRSRRTDRFGTDQLADAYQRLDERYREVAAESPGDSSGLPELTNAANEIVLRLIDARDRGDVDVAASLLREEFVFRRHDAAWEALDAESLGRADWLQNFRTLPARLEAAPKLLARQVIAIRQDELVLNRSVDSVNGNEAAYVALTECRDGQVVSTDTWPEHRLRDALDELDRRLIEIGGTELDGQVIGRMRRAIAKPTLDRADMPMSDDFFTVDHRPLGLGRRSLDEVLETMRAVMPIEAVYTVRAFDVRPPFVFTQTRYVVDEGGSTWEMLTISRLRGVEMVESYQFDLDQYDEARAFFDSLTSPGDSSGVPELTNEANEIAVRILDARDLGDAEVGIQLIHADFEQRWLTPESDALGHRTVDRTGYVSRVGEALADVVSGPMKIVSREVIAVRGEELVLARLVDSQDGNEWPVLTLVECRDGQMVALTMWSPDQLGDALDELDRRCVELGVAELVAEIGGRYRRAMAKPTLDRADLPLTDDFVTIDHRSVGLGRRTLDEVLETTRSVMPIEVMYVVRTFENRPPFTFNEVHYVLDDGGSTWEMLQVSRIRGTELVETHTFDLDQYDEARAYFDSLTSTAVVPELRNRATEIGRRVLDACERLDRSDLHELLADDMVYEYRTDADLTLGGAGSGRERYIDDVLEASRLSDGALLTTAREILAVRGEALYLAEGSVTVGGSSWPYLCLIEARDDRFRRVVFWHESDLDEALRELDRRWVEIDGDSPMRAWGRAWRSAWQSGDLAEVDRLLAPDMRSIDHRQLGLGVRDRAAFLASTTPSAGPGLRFVTRRHLAATDRCGLALVSTTVGDDELVDGLALGLIDDEGRLELQEMFDTAQLDEARRRFDELTSIDG
ncbi:MAG: adenylate/guanylate cyclase domain-containing protein, partial [Actinomycetota bacterium]